MFRRSLLWLLVPFLLYGAALPLVNRVEPRILGVPFFFAWLAFATVVTPVAVWLTWRADRRDGRA
ncbi:DUF3311 domain-containing protein [Streptomyces boninensis]|uniref:DUF3311 domain-containing protein n=1 Tax=Streptomyces boninensis TaxID=2039455 RepID=UPI003B20DB84